MRAPEAETTAHSGLWKEWREGINFVRLNRVVTILFISVVLLNFGGIMLDPMAAPYIVDIVKAGPQVFGWLVTVQAVGGIDGGLLAGRVGQRMNMASLYGWSELVLGVIIFIRYNIPYLPVLFVMTFLIGLPAALGMTALDTLFQQKVPNSHLGRIISALNTTVGLTSLFGVLGISGMLGEILGIIPLLNIAAAITFFTGVFILLFLPTWLSTLVTSLACAIELSASGTSPANLAIPAMAGIHVLIGVGEAVITVRAVAFLYSARRDLLDSGTYRSGAAVWILGALISAVLVGLAPFASAHPDGLEWVAEQLGFLGQAREPFLRLIPGYLVPGLESEALATILAGAVGVLLILGAYLAIARTRRSS